MATENQNGWNEYSRLVLKELETLEEANVVTRYKKGNVANLVNSLRQGVTPPAHAAPGG